MPRVDPLKTTFYNLLYPAYVQWQPWYCKSTSPVTFSFLPFNFQYLQFYTQHSHNLTEISIFYFQRRFVLIDSHVLTSIVWNGMPLATGAVSVYNYLVIFRIQYKRFHWYPYSLQMKICMLHGGHFVLHFVWHRNKPSIITQSSVKNSSLVFQINFAAHNLVGGVIHQEGTLNSRSGHWTAFVSICMINNNKARLFR